MVAGDDLAPPETPVRAPLTTLLASPAIGPAELYIASLLSPVSQRTAKESLRRITRILTGATDRDAWRDIPWHTLTAKETSLIRTAVVGQYKPATARMTVSMLRGVLKQAYRLELMSAETYQRAIMLDPIKQKSARAGRMLKEEEVEKLAIYLAGIPLPDGAMLQAIFGAGLGAGLRREELSSLKATALSNDDSRLLVMGKGRKERAQALPTWVRPVLRRWVDVRSRLGLKSETMFVHLDRDTPFDPKAMWYLICSVRDEAGLTHFTPHDLRRTFASRMMDRSDLSTAQQLMGHESASTTVIYDRRGEDAAAKAVEGLEGWGMEHLVTKEDLLKATLGEIAGPTLTKAETTTHPTTGQPLVHRRTVTRPDFLRDGRPLDLTWVRKQAAALRANGRGTHVIKAVLHKVGVRRADGSEIDEGDVARWLT